MNEHAQLWENALVEIELAVSEANFSTWFKGSFILKQEEGIESEVLKYLIHNQDILISMMTAIMGDPSKRIEWNKFNA